MRFDEIKKVRKMGDIKMITIPKHSEINLGDFVMIKKIPKEDVPEIENKEMEEIPKL